MKIKGKIAIVTGGGSGLGAATARHLANKGARLALLDKDGEKVNKVAQEMGAWAGICDVSKAQSVQESMEQIKQKLGIASIVVNCAGIACAARMIDKKGQLSTQLFDKVLQVNLMGSYYMLSHAARMMMALPLLDGEESRGIIINTASIAYEDGQIGQTAYAASKGAIASLSLPAARELSAYAIRVMAIAPGLFHTPMMEELPQEVTQKITQNIPFPHRLGKPEEYAKLAAHMIENDYLNGQTLRLDGAVRLPPR